MADQIIEQEEWRPIEGQPGYEVSSLGRVRSLPRTIIRGNGHRQPVKGCILKQQLWRRPTSGPYWLVHFGSRFTSYTHVLVCAAFHGSKPTPKHIVGFRDRDGLNNRSDNLRWVTYKENEDDKRLHGRRPHLLSEKNVREIRVKIGQGVMSTEIAKAYSVHPTTIADIKFRRTWVWLD